MVYLRQHKPARSQFRSPRRSRPTGLTVVHTAESALDAIGADTGAEAVASFIAGRSTPGSYHDIVDTDSVVQLVEYSDEAYQDGTGSNPYALSISFACRAADWPRMSPARRAAFLEQGARAFARQQAWLSAKGYPLTPLRRISRAASAGGAPGFIPHADRDPKRRTDPGAAFPWADWFQACAAAVGAPTEEDDVSPEEIQDAAGKAMHSLLKQAAAAAGAKDAGEATPTGRQVRDYLVQILVPSVAAQTRLLLAQDDDVDEAALAAALVPLLTVQMRSLSDTDLTAIATAVADENHRRTES